MSCPVKSSREEVNSCPISKENYVEICSSDVGDVKFSKDQVNSCPLIKESSAEIYNPNVGDIAFGQNKQPNQKISLSTSRPVSTIPKTAEFTPEHQPKDENLWVYPSEQQYYNAMKRKGYNVHETEVPAILAIHNSVNEKGWLQIMEWESLRGCSNPKLKRFLGRPNDLSPKARFLSFILGYKKPFDRHDWIVDRDGKEVRYVIDFYRGTKSSFTDVSMFLDVRPALDSFAAISDRISFSFRSYFAPWSLPAVDMTKFKKQSPR